MIETVLTPEQLTEQPTAQPASSSGSPPAAQPTWHEANLRYLSASLSALYGTLKTSLFESDRKVAAEPVSSNDLDPLLDSANWSFSEPPAIEQLCSAFELSPFERELLLLASAVELDSRFASLYADATRRALPTLQLAFSTSRDPHWSALSPSRPLRYWQLIELLPADSLLASPFRVNERILHFLSGVETIDERLQHVVRPLPAPDLLPGSYASIANQIAAAWNAPFSNTQQLSSSSLPVIELRGSERDAARTISAAAASSLDLNLYRLSSRHLAHVASAEGGFILRLLERETILSNLVLLIEAEDLSDPASGAAIAHLLESLQVPLILFTSQPCAALSRSRVVFDISRPTRVEQAALWQSSVEAERDTVTNLVTQFNLGPVAILSAAHRASVVANADPSADSARLLWDACLIEARPHLEGLAQRVEPAATWNDLVLPAHELEQLHLIALHVRQRITVYESWGFAGKGSRGLGISALFAGLSGTGKTTAAEVLANELHLDLFRVDLSQVISKYIGETEKNLGRIFDAAEEGSAVLLFDEADALFGKRTEVKDSHDRYANVEVSYLLQRMEAYRGLAILTTNRRQSLDQAFLRRLRFIVEFSFPHAAQRVELWRRIFPASTPTEGLNIERLARLRVSGGNIRNIALGAAFLAAHDGQPVRMQHLLAASRTEFAKLETPLSDAEVAGWL